MGVRGLDSYMRRRLVIKRETPSDGSVLVVDGDSFIHWISNGIDRTRAVYYTEFRDRVQGFCSAYARFRLVVVFDGSKEPIKRLTHEYRYLKGARACEKLSSDVPLPMFTQFVALECFKCFENVELIRAPAEADGLCCKLALERHAFAVLGIDSDYFVLNIHRYAPLDEIRGNELGCYYKKDLGVDLKVLACILGNDWTRDAASELDAMSERMGKTVAAILGNAVGKSREELVREYVPRKSRKRVTRVMERVRSSYESVNEELGDVSEHWRTRFARCEVYDVHIIRSLTERGYWQRMCPYSVCEPETLRGARQRVVEAGFSLGFTGPPCDIYEWFAEGNTVNFYELELEKVDRVSVFSLLLPEVASLEHWAKQNQLSTSLRTVFGALTLYLTMNSYHHEFVTGVIGCALGHWPTIPCLPLHWDQCLMLGIEAQVLATGTTDWGLSRLVTVADVDLEDLPLVSTYYAMLGDCGVL